MCIPIADLPLPVTHTAQRQSEKKSRISETLNEMPPMNLEKWDTRSQSYGGKNDMGNQCYCNTSSPIRSMLVGSQ